MFVCEVFFVLPLFLICLALFFCFVVVFGLDFGYFETGFLSIVLAILEFSTYTRLALNSQYLPTSDP